MDPNRLVPWAKNPRRNDAAVDVVAASIKELGFGAPVVARRADLRIIAGHTRVKAALKLGLRRVPVRLLDVDEATADRLALADNRLGEVAEWDDAALLPLLQQYVADAELLGWTEADVEALVRASRDDGGAAAAASAAATLAERFVVPPFTVLDARQGYWRDRKAAWIALGLKSFLGRENIVQGAQAPKPGRTAYSTQHLAAYRKAGSSEAPPDAGVKMDLSIFDPVLCEVAYRWFCPPGGVVLDPFAGGSVRGLVATRLGRRYYGVDLRAEQVAANRGQWEELAPRFRPRVSEPIVDAYQGSRTPLERRGSVWFKREDQFAIAGVAGGKVRTCWELAKGAVGLVTAGSRASPQVNIVAHIARRLGIPCRVHVPAGELSPELLSAQASGAEVVQHRPGYNTVIVARARVDAADRGWTEIPFGMECVEAVRQTAAQVAVLPKRVRRIVVPVGSGMSLAGVLHGLQAARSTVPVVGVVVGADPTERLDRYAPPGWRDRVTLVRSALDYHEEAPVTELEGVPLDPIYEAKCIPIVEPGDLLWVVGIRETARVVVQDVAPTWVVGDATRLGAVRGLPAQADLVFSCPPYMDLEVYSDDPADLSAMDDAAFWQAYRAAIAAAAARLRDDRFAVWVVGELRGPDGTFKGFVPGTIAAFAEAGCRLYNDGVLVTPLLTLPMRTGNSFTGSRKLGRAHQTVLVFVKGDPRRAVAACGDVAVAAPDLEADE
jgi:Pyridoxal-phosphate dependent enzyme/ParB-like nuclease domain